MVKAHIIVGGIVQGVSFRWFVRDEAGRIGLKGTVRNLYNGDVEVWVEGESDDIDSLIEAMKKGNGYSKVVKCQVDRSDFTGDYDDFRIVFWHD